MHDFNCVILLKKALDIMFEEPECISCDYHCVNAVLYSQKLCISVIHNIIMYFVGLWVLCWFLFVCSTKKIRKTAE